MTESKAAKVHGPAEEKFVEGVSEHDWAEMARISADAESQITRLEAKLASKFKDDAALAAFKNELAEQKRELDRVKREHFLPPIFSSAPSAALAIFDVHNLSVELRYGYVDCLIQYQKTENNNYVIELFTDFVNHGITPPKWMMEILAGGFEKHLKDPDRDLDRLATRLGLRGIASGSTNPWHQLKRRRKRSAAMHDMVILMQKYGVSQLRAAKAVKIKYKLDASPTTLKNYYQEYFGADKDLAERVTRFVVMKFPEGTRFVSSFPVAARKLINKK